MRELISIHGHITLHEIPAEWTDADFKRLWCPVTDRNGQILRPAIISGGEKRARQVAETENLLTSIGITLWLTNGSVSGQGNMNPFTQILSVGNGSISSVSRSDTSVSGDGFVASARKAPASYAVSGFQTTIYFNFASGDAQAFWTNLGIYGYKTASSQAATTTAGTGALMTHALINYNKVASAIAVAYTFVLSN
jgi:hypothetical protein